MQTAPVGEQLKEWRSRRRLSQMDLALDIEISTRHLSFIETGRAKPSVHMLHRLAERLDIPHRSRNGLLLAAGYAAWMVGDVLRRPFAAVSAAMGGQPN